ncbi:hypothetical protein RJ641_017135 [Dillenia turbinata]|uniref:PRP1 splicing factor N-terminal domain-containing protein n=1 Tax=Dillenia turbinata TaxID=194707 RepID=A0AAN8UKU3_9MAGN
MLKMFESEGYSGDDTNGGGVSTKKGGGIKIYTREKSASHTIPDEAKAVIARGVKVIPKSVKLWMQAAKLEHEDVNRSRVFRKGLEHIPDIVRLWKAIVELTNEEAARHLLQRITGAKLEKANENTAMVGKIIERGIRTLQREEVEIARETWMKEAEAAERTGSMATCQAIIHNWDWGKVNGSKQLEKSHGTRESLDELLRRAVKYTPQAEVLWQMGAKEKLLAGDVPGARDILREAYLAIPNSEEIWLAAFKLEFENNEPERARMILARAREKERNERVWMKSAIVERELGNTVEERSVEKKMRGLSKARVVLTTARKKNPHNPELWLAAIRAELRHGNKKESENLMAKTLQQCRTKHFQPLLGQISKLEEALYNIQFEQHCTAILCVVSLIVANEEMSRRALHKAIFESVAPISVGALQVYLLQRLFERKLGTTRV